MLKLGIIAVLVISSFAFVKWYSDQQFQAGYDKATAAYESLLREELNGEIRKNKELQKSVDSIAKTWLNYKPKVEYVYETITKEIPKYIKDDRACDITRGGVGLLNEAADPKERLPDDSGAAIADAEKQAASTVTQRAAINYCIGWAEQYNELARQHDALIDVVETYTE